MKKTSLLIILLVLTITISLSAQESPRQILENSPRHHEWVKIKQGDREVHAFLVYAEVKEKALAVLIIHENGGLTDWVRSMADRIAAAGYIAIAPDLLSGMGPGGGGTNAFADSDAAREAIYALPQDQITADLNAVVDYVTKLPAATGKAAIAGFCWGGTQAFDFATKRSGLSASFVFYGTAPDTPGAIAKISAPVYGFYGGDDARVNSTLPETARLMKEAGKTFEPVTYSGAGHAFMKRGEEAYASEANKKAKDAAWKRWLALLKSLK